MSESQLGEVDESEIETILAEDIDFDGKLYFSDSLMIKGVFRGNIKADGLLYVGESANVNARLEADVISLKGYVKGNIFGHTRVELYACARVDGDITAPDVIMESGCSFNGICTTGSPPGLSSESDNNE